MKRFYLLLCVLVAIGCDNQPAKNAAAVSSAEKKETYNWKMVTTWPKNLPGLGTSPERMAKKN